MVVRGEDHLFSSHNFPNSSKNLITLSDSAIPVVPLMEITTCKVSRISSFVAPAFRAESAWERMQFVHPAPSAMAIDINRLILTLKAPSL